jgi:hypothetical protein
MLRLLIAAAACACTLAAPAAAFADIRDIRPGDVGAWAHTRMDAETFARDSSLQESDFWNETTTGTAGAVSSYRWPLSPAPGGEAFSCAQTGCAGYDGRASASADVAAGRLQAVATASVYVGNAPNDGHGLAGYIFSDGAAAIADTITLSKPAIVVLKGSVTGGMGGSADTYQQPSPQAQVLASFSFTGERECGPSGGEGCSIESFGGYEQQYDAPILDCPTGGTCAVSSEYWTSPAHRVDESFEVSVALPAGTTYFTAKLWAAVDFQVYGLPLVFVSSNAFLDFGNSAVFEIQVPDDVVASSGSGLLPLVGGSGGDPDPPEDTEAPLLQLPPDVTAEAAGPDGAAVTYTASATDERDPSPSLACTPPSGSTFALGTSTVSCAATDAAGNEASGAFSVRVVDTIPPVLSLGKLATTIRAYEFVGTTVSAFPAEATDLVDATPLVVCTPAAGERLPVGETLVRCTATDDAGNRAEASVTIVVLGPTGLLTELNELVRAAGLDVETEQKLLTPLERARRALLKSDVAAAEAALESFAREVEKQSQKGTITQANARSFSALTVGWIGGVSAPGVAGLVEKIGRVLATLRPGLGSVRGAARFLQCLYDAQRLVADGNKGRAIAKLGDAEDQLDELVRLGQVAAELGSAVKLDISALRAALRGGDKGASGTG